MCFPCRSGSRPRAERILVLSSTVLLCAAVLAGCGDSTSTTTAATGSTTSAPATAASHPAIAKLTLTDAWVKAAPSGMTAIFGTLTNPTGSDMTIVSGTTSAASKIELHEVVMDGGVMKMRPKIGGFVVPAHGTHALKPGGDHIMVMGLTGPIKAGDTVTATLTLKDGSAATISAIGKEFAGGNETYAPSGSTGMGMSPSPTMS